MLLFFTRLSIVLFNLSLGYIAFYTSKIRKLEKNEPYKGFIMEVLLTGTITNDIAPILITYKFDRFKHKFGKLYDPKIDSMHKSRNYWVITFWLDMILLITCVTIDNQH